MRKKIIVILTSLISALIIMSVGYGKWQKRLTIVGDIRIVPNPKVIQQLQELALEMEKLQAQQNLLNQQMVGESALSETLSEQTADSEESTIEEQITTIESEQSNETTEVIDSEQNIQAQDVNNINISPSSDENTNSEDNSTGVLESISSEDNSVDEGSNGDNNGF